jgi:protein-S-isoprenylcysteine O-methyltransferase Ste14
MTLGFYLKARREEQLLTAELGAPYDSYRQRVPMLLPRVALTRTDSQRP